MNSDIYLAALGLLVQDPTITEFDVAVARIQAKVEQLTFSENDHLMNEEKKQAGCEALSIEEYFSSESCKQKFSAGFYEISQADMDLPPTWWPENPSKP